MFGWLTRNDGARKARIRRRLKSPRGSVFSEFAIVMPVVLLMCSAIFELIGFWDAQVMANHAAWQVGRIAAVRGDDGMAFSETVSKMSKTGVISEKMPTAIQVVLKPLVTTIGGTLDKFNDRGVITTMFLMSTCEIGYYGPTPGEAISEVVEKLIDDAVKGIVDDFPAWVEEWVKENDKTADWIPSGSGAIGKLVTDLINYFINQAVKPILGMVADVLKAVVKDLVKLLKIDELFSGGSAAARRARQFYGAAIRVVKAQTAVSAVSELTEAEGPFVFAKGAKWEGMGRLAYPLVIDKEAKSDGYFVTGAHGWPPNNQALQLVKVEVNWPYSRGWLFPVVSGYGKTSAPVAKGTSIAFPQPGITDKNLWSTGAVEYAAGDYESKMSDAYKAVADDMKKYLALAKFGMEYRLCKDTISLSDTGEWWESWTRKCCDPLHEMFDTGWEGDYAETWSRITHGSSQYKLMRELEEYFKKENYRSCEYFFWEGTCHRRYSYNMIAARGRVGYGRWCETNPQYCASMGGGGCDCISKGSFADITKRYKKEIKDAGLKSDDIYEAYRLFNGRVGRFKLRDIVQWKDPGRYRTWFSEDMRIQSESYKVDERFDKITTLLEAEIKDIQNVLDGNMSEYTGDDGDDFIIDPNDQDAIDNPEEASRKAMEKWLVRKKELRLLLQDIDRKIRDPDNNDRGLNKAWSEYRSAASSIMACRQQAVNNDLARACVLACIETKSTDILKRGSVDAFSRLLRDKNLIEYDMVGATLEFGRLQDVYGKALEDSFKAEVEYGTKLGLASARKTKKSGKSIDELDFDTDVFPDGHGGTLGPGSDSGWPIDGDNQKWTPTGGWQ